MASTFDDKIKFNDFRGGCGFREGASIGPANYERSMILSNKQLPPDN